MESGSKLTALCHTHDDFLQSVAYYSPVCEAFDELITTKLLDFVHRPDFHKPENTMFRKLDLFPSSGEGGEGRQLLYKKNQRLAPPPRLRMETDPVSETLCFLVCGNPDDGQNPEA
jgi:hypothetical protein